MDLSCSITQRTIAYWMNECPEEYNELIAYLSAFQVDSKTSILSELCAKS